MNYLLIAICRTSGNQVELPVDSPADYQRRKSEMMEDYSRFRMLERYSNLDEMMADMPDEEVNTELTHQAPAS
jgi:hypothetical protein